MAQKQIVASGSRPTGKSHLGHLFGQIEGWTPLQDDYDCFYFVADWFRPKYLLGKILRKSPNFWRNYAGNAAKISAGGGYVYWVHFRSNTSAVREPPVARHFADVCREDTVRCVEPLRRKLGGS